MERNEGTEMPLTSFTRLSFPYTLTKHEFTEGESALHPPLRKAIIISPPHQNTKRRIVCAVSTSFSL